MHSHTILLVLGTLSVGAISAGSEEPIHRWQLTREHFRRQAFGPLYGRTAVQVTHGRQDGKVRFDDERPGAVRLDPAEDGALRLTVTEDLNKLDLPRDAITVAVWARVDLPLAYGGFAGIIQDNGDDERGWLLGYRDRHFCFAMKSTGAKRLTYLTAEPFYQTGYWYHVVGTYDGREQRLYVDGKPVARSDAQSGPIDHPPQGVFCLGAYQDDNERHPMTGQMERVTVWHRTLSASEVERLFLDRKEHFPEIDPVRPRVKDWPTFRRDNQRTASSEQKVALPLRLKWQYRALSPPAPAWPPPAKQDFWHRKFDLRPRVAFDRAFHVVSVGDRIYFGSSADDQVYCLDAKTGKPRWTFFAEGPIRFAPTVADDKLLFGSDDGRVYCLDRESGELIWKFAAFSKDRRIPGNGRIISDRPVRSGVLVDGPTAHFCAGLFPAQGAEQFTVDIETGKPVTRSRLTVSPQGYLQRRAGQLYVPTGRDPAGAFTAELLRRGKEADANVRNIPAEFPYAMIATKDARFAAGQGIVAALDAKNGQRLWSKSVEGRAYSLAVARERLYASTDTGAIYCFGPQGPEETPTADRAASETPVPQATAEARRLAERIIARGGTGPGYCLVLEPAVSLLLALAEQSKWQIVAAASSPTAADAMRKELARASVYGTRVCVHRLDSGRGLPYTDHLFNLIVADAATGPVNELRRVLCPGRGVALIDDGELRKEPPAGVGAWSHMYADAANTACSADRHVGGPLRLQWFGGPGPRKSVDRHHRHSAPLCADGRVFVPGDDRVMALDAYNGTLLWEAAVKDSRRIAALRDCGQMALGNDVLYVAAAATCRAFDAETGRTIREFGVPADDSAYDWGYVATVGDRLYGSAVKQGGSRRAMSREVIDRDVYGDGRSIVGSDRVFAMDPDSGEILWQYRSNAGLIVNPTLAIGEGRLYFVESCNRETLADRSPRATAEQLLDCGSTLVTLDAANGKVLWRRTHDLSAVEHNLYLSQAAGKLVVVGSRNSHTDPKQAEVLFDVWVFHADTGEAAWRTTQRQGTRIGGTHGEQDLHPVIVGDRLVCEPYAYQLHDGRPTDDWRWRKGSRRGCGTISASAAALFFRNATAARYDLATHQYGQVTTSTRPGCWINMIPAGGLLLIPEASSGCTCNFAIQTSAAFLPVDVE